MYQSDLKHPSQTLEDKLHALHALGMSKDIILELPREPYFELLKAFGNPQHKLPPVIHVAGTNGKGSTIAMLRAIYEAAGYRVHAYTSPHLIRFNERIVLAGEQIDDKSLEALIDETLELNNNRDATFFEATTAMALAAFSRKKADICLLEVGLGGRLDCTNIIETAALNIITPIGLDHMDFLGDTLDQIAAEKAGILKPGVPCVIGPQRDEAMAAIKNRATQIAAPIIEKNTDRSVCPQIALQGAHQAQNAQTVLTAIAALQDQFPVPDAAIQQGFETINWPARLQRLSIAGKDVILDGGHNKDAGQAVAAYLKELEPPIHLIFCMMKHKDPKAYLRPLLPHLASITTTQIPNEPAGLNADDLRNEIAEICGDTPLKTSQNYKEALSSLNNGTILITGSLYLAGQVLKDIENSAHT